jgi:hypothetical protein
VEGLLSIVLALTDDLNRLAAQDVVYLTRTFSAMPTQTHGSTEVFAGRLRQALNGDWVFNASTGQNGVVGFMLGGVNQNSWTSAESSASGLQVTATINAVVGIAGAVLQTLAEVIVLTNVIPTDFAE